jgi:hypothetical protein
MKKTKKSVVWAADTASVANMVSRNETFVKVSKKKCVLEKLADDKNEKIL